MELNIVEKGFDTQRKQAKPIKHQKTGFPTAPVLANSTIRPPKGRSLFAQSFKGEPSSTHPPQLVKEPSEPLPKGFKTDLTVEKYDWALSHHGDFLSDESDTNDGAIRLDSLLAMTRSSIVSQRAFAMKIFANAVKKAKESKFGGSAESKEFLDVLFQFGIVMVAIASLESKHRSEVENASTLLLNLLHFREESFLDGRFGLLMFPRENCRWGEVMLSCDLFKHLNTVLKFTNDLEQCNSIFKIAFILINTNESTSLSFLEQKSILQRALSYKSIEAYQLIRKSLQCNRKFASLLMDMDLTAIIASSIICEEGDILIESFRILRVLLNYGLGGGIFVDCLSTFVKMINSEYDKYRAAMFRLFAEASECLLRNSEIHDHHLKSLVLESVKCPRKELNAPYLDFVASFISKDELEMPSLDVKSLEFNLQSLDKLCVLSRYSRLNNSRYAEIISFLYAYPITNPCDAVYAQKIVSYLLEFRLTKDAVSLQHELLLSYPDPQTIRNLFAALTTPEAIRHYQSEFQIPHDLNLSPKWSAKLTKFIYQMDPTEVSVKSKCLSRHRVISFELDSLLQPELDQSLTTQSFLFKAMERCNAQELPQILQFAILYLNSHSIQLDALSIAPLLLHEELHFLDPVVSFALESIVTLLSPRLQHGPRNFKDIQFFSDLVDQFTSVGFGSHGFLHFLLLNATQLDPIENRTKLWTELSPLLSRLQCYGIWTLPPPEFMLPVEEDNFLIQVHSCALLDGKLDPTRTPLLLEIITHHISAYLHSSSHIITGDRKRLLIKLSEKYPQGHPIHSKILQDL